MINCQQLVCGVRSPRESFVSAYPLVPCARNRPRSAPAAVSQYGIALAKLDGDGGVRPGCHMFVSSKTRWFEITDEWATGRRRCRKIEGYVSQLTYLILDQW